jgi:hypothetical protein
MNEAEMIDEDEEAIDPNHERRLARAREIADHALRVWDSMTDQEHQSTRKFCGRSRATCNDAPPRNGAGTPSRPRPRNFWGSRRGLSVPPFARRDDNLPRWWRFLLLRNPQGRLKYVSSRGESPIPCDP